LPPAFRFSGEIKPKKYKKIKNFMETAFNCAFSEMTASIKGILEEKFRGFAQ
jgi:hypothetical protein